MKPSFSRSRFGVIRRMSSARCAVCFGGSNEGSWSLKGRPSRYCSMTSLMSSPSSGTGHCANGPTTALQFENVVVSFRTAIASS